MNLDHKHIIVRATVKKPPTEVDYSIDWMKRVVDAVGMKIVLGPFAHYCDAKDNEGITGMCCISTSHLSLQVWSKIEPPVVHFDLYSCATFDVYTVLGMLCEFEPYSYDWVMIDRNETLKVYEHGQFQK